MSPVLVLVIVFAAVALGLSAFAVWIAQGARGAARQALASSHSHVRTAPRRPEPHVERRDENFGPPNGEPDRRRHRAPEDTPRARRRDADDPQYRIEPVDATTSIPRVDADGQPVTAEHPAPTTQFRSPPPPLPRPGSIPHPPR